MFETCYNNVTPPVANDSVTFDIDFLGSSIVNNTYTSENKLYWNVFINSTVTLDNFSYNLDGAGYEKFLDLPFGQSIDMDTKFPTNQIFGITYNNTNFVGINKNADLLHVFDRNYNYVTNATTSVGGCTVPEDIEYNNNDNQWFLSCNGNILILNSDLSYNGTSYDLSSITGESSLTNGNLYYDEDNDILYVSEGLNNDRVYLFDSNLNYDRYYNVTTSNAFDLTKYNDNFYITNENANVYIYNSTFAYNGTNYSLSECGFGVRGIVLDSDIFYVSCGVDNGNSKSSLLIYDKTFSANNNYTVYYNNWDLAEGKHNISFGVEN